MKNEKKNGANYKMKRLKSHKKDITIGGQRIRCYDMPGHFDRYTAVFLDSGVATPGRANCIIILCMSENPQHPQGFGSHSDISSLSSANLGRIVDFTYLPEKVQQCITNTAEG